MSSTSEGPPAQTPDQAATPDRLGVFKKLAIWALFLALLYLLRDFFFTVFMTFLFCYLTLAVVGWGMRKLSPERDRPGLRRLLTVAVFVLVPLALLGVGALVVPRLLEQGQHLAGWLGNVTLESETARVLEKYVGRSQFKEAFGGPEDPRYQQGLEEFRNSGVSHVKAYNDFPSLEAWVEGSFRKQFSDAERGRIRSQLIHEGTSSKEFSQWFLTKKVPQLQAQAKKQPAESGSSPSPLDPLVRAAASAKPEQLLEQARHDAPALALLRQEWIRDTVERGVAEARSTPRYLERFRSHYEKMQARSPKHIPYTFDQFLALQKVRPQGPRAFGEALDRMNPSSEEEREARLRADFEAAKEHELFQTWWSTNSTAQFIRHQVESGVGGGSGRMDHLLSSLLNVPLDLGTALLLSLFICIDFPNLKRGVRRLRETWLRDVYDEMAPALTHLGELIGRAMHAQGLIAFCNATLLFLALTFLGVEHAALLGLAVFILCLVPTLGTLIAWALIVVFTLIQPDGGLALALKASVAVLIVVLLETFVFSPRILGKMMELHPVLIIALLPLAQYFFGVWGLILATPVAVYVLEEVILRRPRPGSAGPPAGAAPSEAAPAPDASGQAAQTK
jgi:predicted PurR-regulated permease PerM